MPLTLKVGLSREVGLAGEGSFGVSCHIEVRIDVASLLEVDGFDRTVEQAFFVCDQAVDDELRRQRRGCVDNTRGRSAGVSPEATCACRAVPHALKPP